MNIRMLTDMQGSNDGPTVQTFKKDEEYTVGKGIHEDLANVFLKEGWAENVTAGAGDESGDEKQGTASPENKDAGVADTNKADVPVYPHTDYRAEALGAMSMDQLREIGTPLGLKGTKKDDLANEILLKQKERRDAWEKENA